MKKEIHYEVCPLCQSPEIEDSGDYYKCSSCGDIFDFPEDVPIEERCPQCNNININIIEIDSYGMCTFKCFNCKNIWYEELV